MRKLFYSLTAITFAALMGCSGGSDNTLSVPGGPGGAGPTAPIGTLTLLTSSPQIPSDGADDATITALVRDSNNNVMADVGVLFTSNSGSLVVDQPPVTDVNGQAAATLSTAGDPTNRTVTVSAIADTAQATVTVDVVGTTLLLNGPASLPLSDTGSYNVVLTDAGGSGIGGIAVSITSSNGNTIAPTPPLTTDVAGQASFTLTADNGGADTLTAQALGLTATQSVNVSTDAFTFAAPAPNTEIPLNTNQTVTVNWQQSGAAVVGQPVSFSSTRGTVSAQNVNTDAMGNATITVSATNAGPAVITATNGSGTSTQLIVEFVATVPDTIELQATPFTVAPQEQSAITAIVRDPAGNLVKNQTLDFSLNDVTGGSLSVASAITDSQGRAQTFYTASTTTSASNGVAITATVRGTAVSDTVNLTVAQRELFISIGTGNTLFEPNSAQYRMEFAVQVTDSQGNGVEGVTVQTNILSERYFKGFWSFPAGADSWVRNETAQCLDEDLDRDGILDGAEDGLVACNGVLDPGEDLNGNMALDFGDDFNASCLIEAGNIATATPQGGGGSSFVTDENGFGLVDVVYPQEYSTWVEVTLEAKTSVQGTEFREPNTFILPVLASDVQDENVTPPARIKNFRPESPFGSSNLCSDTL